MSYINDGLPDSIVSPLGPTAPFGSLSWFITFTVLCDRSTCITSTTSCSLSSTLLLSLVHEDTTVPNGRTDKFEQDYFIDKDDAGWSLSI